MCQRTRMMSGCLQFGHACVTLVNYDCDKLIALFNSVGMVAFNRTMRGPTGRIMIGGRIASNPLFSIGSAAHVPRRSCVFVLCIQEVASVENNFETVHCRSCLMAPCPCTPMLVQILDVAHLSMGHISMDSV